MKSHSCPYSRRARLPFQYGSFVYEIFAGANLLYVGRTRNLRTRFYRHHKADEFAKHGATHILWIEFDEPPYCNAKAIRCERHLILSLLPPLNHVGVPVWKRA